MYFGKNEKKNLWQAELRFRQRLGKWYIEYWYARENCLRIPCRTSIVLYFDEFSMSLIIQRQTIGKCQQSERKKTQKFTLAQSVCCFSILFRCIFVLFFAHSRTYFCSCTFCVCCCVRVVAHLMFFFFFWSKSTLHLVFIILFLVLHNLFCFLHHFLALLRALLLAWSFWFLFCSFFFLRRRLIDSGMSAHLLLFFPIFFSLVPSLRFVSFVTFNKNDFIFINTKFLFFFLCRFSSVQRCD